MAKETPCIPYDEAMPQLRDFLARTGWSPGMLKIASELLENEQLLRQWEEPVYLTSHQGQIRIDKDVISVFARIFRKS